MEDNPHSFFLTAVLKALVTAERNRKVQLLPPPSTPTLVRIWSNQAGLADLPAGLHRLCVTYGGV